MFGKFVMTHFPEVWSYLHSDVIILLKSMARDVSPATCLPVLQLWSRLHWKIPCENWFLTGRAAGWERTPCLLPDRSITPVLSSFLQMWENPNRRSVLRGTGQLSSICYLHEASEIGAERATTGDQCLMQGKGLTAAKLSLDVCFPRSILHWTTPLGSSAHLQRKVKRNADDSIIHF